MTSSRNCPICNTSSLQADVFLNENIDPDRLSSFSFASRKTPEFMCHRMVCCSNCDLVYADAPPSQTTLAQSYHTASYDSAEEANDAAQSYALAIRPIIRSLTSKDVALEIGTGTGIFLEHLESEGFINLIGVEPSTAAINAAPNKRRAWIREGMFEESDFEPQSVDLICCFMTMEHVLEPRLLAESASRLLKPGGAFVTVTHDYRSIVNRILGKKSPIIDVEHLQIFSKKSISALLKKADFTDISVSSFKNRYSLRYWIRLCPLPNRLKSTFEKILGFPIFNKLHLTINVGNTIAVGFKKT